MISLTKDRRMLGYGSLSSYSNISHFVTTRQGGYSEGTYSSFNCTPYSGDDEETVRKNQMLLIEGMPHKPKELVIPKQMHTTNCMLIEDIYLISSPQARKEMLNGIDAMMTHERGYCLCISTADCVPVLVYDRKRNAVAAIHAGWRGTVGRLLDKTLHAMHDRFATMPEDVIACLGPSISLDAFEVGEEVYEAFRKCGFDMSRVCRWNRETEKHHIDLWEANRIQLLEFGVPAGQIEVAGICTYTHSDEFFSARRLGIQSGRILSGIMINE